MSTLTAITLQLPTTDFGKPNPFIAHLGFVLTVFAHGESEIQYTAKPEHLNSYGVTHGGAVMSLLDVTMAMAARADRQVVAPHRHPGLYRRHGV